MTLLHKSPESFSSHRIDSPPDPLENINSLFHTVYQQIARLKGSIEPFTKNEIDIKPGENGYLIISPTDRGRSHVDKVGFDVLSKAVELAMISQDWGIVKEVDKTHETITIFIPGRASQRQ
jgi:hypothetical protein